MTLLAQDVSGWARLCRIVSAAHAAPVDGVPVAPWPVLQEHLGPGLVVLLGPSSEPVAALMTGRPDLAEHLLMPWRVAAGEGLRLEAVHLGRTGTGAGSGRLAGRTVQLADQLCIPVVLSNGVRYADAAQHRMADVLDAARLLRPIDRRALDGGERWLKDGVQMTAVAGQVAEAAGHGRDCALALLAETAETAASCTLTTQELGMGRPQFPEPQSWVQTGRRVGRCGCCAIAARQAWPLGAWRRMRPRCAS